MPPVLRSSPALWTGRPAPAPAARGAGPPFAPEKAAFARQRENRYRFVSNKSSRKRESRGRKHPQACRRGCCGRLRRCGAAKYGRAGRPGAHGLLSACCPVSQRFLVQAARVDGADAEVHLGCAGARKAALLIQADGRDVAHTDIQAKRTHAALPAQGPPHGRAARRARPRP